MDGLNFVIENWELIFGILGSALAIAFTAGGFVVWCKMSISNNNNRISILEKKLEEKSSDD